jgi:hypothetical protein
MIDPFTVATTTISIVNTITQFNNLLNALNAAPEEFKRLASQVKSLTQVLASIRTDLVEDRDSIINRSNHLRAENRLDLDDLVKQCEKGVKRVQRLFNDYKGVTRHGFWSRWRWTNEGEQEVRSSLAGLQSLTGLISLFIQKEIAQGVGRLEHLAEEESRARQIGERRQQREIRALREALGLPEPDDPSKDITQLDITQLFATSIFASRWVGRFRARKALQQSGRVNKPATIPNSARNRPSPIPNLPRKNSLRPLGHTARTAGLQSTTKSPSFQFKGWRVAAQSYVIGPTIHKGVPLKRTQLELREMVNLAQSGARFTDKKHHAVKWIMSQQDPEWTFAAWRSEGGGRFAVVLKMGVGG